MFKDLQYQQYNEAFKKLFDYFPYMSRCLEPWLGKSIGELSQQFQQESAATLSDVAQEAIFSMVQPVLGKDVAEALLQSLRHASRMVATHHLGIDCLPEQVQAVHFLELQKLLKPREDVTTIPLLACAGVPLQNYSYPRGLMPARKNAQGQKVRYPLFPSAKQNTLVLAAPALHKKGVQKIVNKWDKSLVSPREWDTINAVVQDIILHEDCLALDTFSQQVMYSNDKIFKAVYPDNPNAHVIYLNLEELATKLVLADLQEPNSVLSAVFFQKSCRDRILKALSNQRACWSERARNGAELERTGTNGTIFFWAIDAQGRRVPLSFQENPDRLVRGSLTFDFNAHALRQALQERRIYPSLYTSFVSMHLQHNLSCYGGIYMVDYLPKMLQATMDALSICSDDVFCSNHAANIQDHYPPVSSVIQNFIPFSGFGSGAMSVKTRTEPSLAESESNSSPQNAVATEYIPAGSLEIIGYGGITRKHLEAIASLKYDDILPMHLADWTFTHIPELKKDTKLAEELNVLCQSCESIHL